MQGGSEATRESIKEGKGAKLSGINNLNQSYNNEEHVPRSKLIKMAINSA